MIIAKAKSGNSNGQHSSPPTLGTGGIGIGIKYSTASGERMAKDEVLNEGNQVSVRTDR